MFVRTVGMNTDHQINACKYGKRGGGCGKTYSWATTVHGRALKHVQDILNEREGEKHEGNHGEG